MTATREDRYQSASGSPSAGGPPPPPRPPWFRLSRGWIVFFLALLVFNFYLGSRATQPQSRVRVPYSPFFLERVSARHVNAIVGMLTEGADPVRKVSIIPRGVALGVTFAAPESDRFNYREPEVQARIDVALGGRAAEEVVFGEMSTGAESDIQQLTEIARQMVGRWGMSSAIGPVAVIPRDGLGPFLPGVAEVSPHTQRLVDEEVRRIVDESHQEVIALLQQNRGKLDSLATALLEHETLDEEDAYAAAGVPRSTTPSADSYSTAARSRIDG